jgi:translocation and assembly module TamB
MATETPKRSLSRRIGRGLVWAVLVPLTVVVLLVLAALAVLFTTPGQTRLQGFALKKVNASIRGQLVLGKLDLDMGGWLRLHDLKLLDPQGRVVVSADLLEVHVDPLALIHHRIWIKHVGLQRPEIRILVDANGASNLTEAIASRDATPPKASSSPAGTPWKLQLDDLALHAGLVDRRSGPQDKNALHVDRIEVSGKAVDVPGDVRVALSGSAQMSAPEQGPLSLDVKAHGTGTTLSDTLTLEALQASLGSSTIEAKGGITQKVAQGHLDVHLAQALALSLGAPLARDLDARIDATWKGDTATADVHVPAAHGEAHLHAAVKPQAKPLAYVATLALTHFDPHALVTPAPEGDLNGVLEVDGQGTSLPELVADLGVRMQASKLHGIRIPALSVKGRIAKEAANLARVEIQLPGGTLHGAGSVSLRAVDVKLDAEVPDLAAFTANLGVVPPYVGSAVAAVHVSGSPKAPALELALTSPRIANPAMQLDFHDIRIDARVPDLTSPTVLAAKVRTRKGHFQRYEIEAFGGDVNLDGTRFVASLHSEGATQLTLRTTGELPGQRHIVTVATLDLALGDTAWTLSGPARIDVAHGARVDRAELASADQKIIVEGGVGQEQLDARVQVVQLDLARLPALLVPPRMGLQGRLDATVTAHGSRTDPKIQAHLEAHGLATASTASRTKDRFEATAEATLIHQRVTAQAQASLGKNALTLDLDAPILARAPASAPINAHLRAKGLDLSVLADLLAQPPRTLTGAVDVELSLTGSLQHPDGIAALTLHEVKAQRSPALNGGIKLVLDEKAILTADLHAGKSTLTGRADLPLPPDPLRHLERLKALRTTPGKLTLALTDLDLDQWRMQFGIPPDADGVISAKLDAHGTLADPRGTLHLDVDRLVYGAYRNLDFDADVVAEAVITAKAELVLQKQPAAHLQARVAETLGALLQRPQQAGQAPVKVTLQAGPFDLAQANEKAHGSVTADLALTGTLDTPELHGHFNGKAVAFSTAPLGEGTVTLDYVAGQLALHAGLPRLTLDARATQTLGLSTLRQGLTLSQVPIDATLRADHFDLAGFSGVSPSISTLGGQVTADAHLQGRAGAPTFRGTLQLDDGRAVVQGFGDFRQVALALTADNNRAELSRLEVHAGAGVIHANAIAVRGGSGGSFKLTGALHAKKFPVESDDQTVAYVQAEAKVDGELSVRDSLIILHFTQVHADIPSMSRKTVQSLSANPDIVILGVTKKKKVLAVRAPATEPGAGASGAAPGTGSSGGAAPAPSAIRVGIFAPGDFWLRGQDLNVDLRASLGMRLGGGGDSVVEMTNPPGRNEPSTVEVVRGKFEVFGRRFDVPNDKPIRVTFEGGPPEFANLDATVLYNDRADGIVVTVKVDGPVRNPHPPQLSSDPPMDSSQLALLIATGHLQGKRGGGQVSATSQAGSVVGSFLAGRLQNTLAKTLPIDTISVETGNGGQIRAEVGKYITDKIYVGYTRNFVAHTNSGSLESQAQNVNEFTLQYQLSQHWQLEAVGGEAQSGLDAIWQKDY